jgi:hypothetical protein
MTSYLSIGGNINAAVVGAGPPRTAQAPADTITNHLPYGPRNRPRPKFIATHKGLQ